jgi:hypothetical protein
MKHAEDFRNVGSLSLAVRRPAVGTASDPTVEQALAAVARGKSRPMA